MQHFPEVSHVSLFKSIQHMFLQDNILFELNRINKNVTASIVVN